MSFTVIVRYRLTATDVDGASNYTTVNITVLPAVDNPPIANAGSAKKLVWPHNHVILYGNASFDDNVCVMLCINFLFVHLSCGLVRVLFHTNGRKRWVL